MARVSFDVIKSKLPKSRNPLTWFKSDKVKVAVIRFNGVIGRSASRFDKGLDYESRREAIEEAFETKKLKAVAMLVNSPGGSPAQSHMIAARIRELADEKKVPVYAFVEDVAASGGYMLACAADEIWADPTSILGSIGVVSAGFGFTGLLEKAGVERRLYTAGRNKAMLDPFSPQKPEDVEHLKALQQQIHEFFIGFVKARRGDRLKDDQEDLFTGAFWVGDEAQKRGLIDGFGSLDGVLKEKFGDKLSLVRVGEEKKSWLSSLLFGSALTGADILTAIDHRSRWNRFGL
ncbi:MAG: S49 family peptidase [Methylobacteriaceae bacterium]|jgi:signal peptide peptidase SppA|nr:S49 family peptidase [Methylobacteriaceae bacterium]